MGALLFLMHLLKHISLPMLLQHKHASPCCPNVYSASEGCSLHQQQPIRPLEPPSRARLLCKCICVSVKLQALLTQAADRPWGEDVGHTACR